MSNLSRFRDSTQRPKSALLNHGCTTTTDTRAGESSGVDAFPTLLLMQANAYGAHLTPLHSATTTSAPRVADGVHINVSSAQSRCGVAVNLWSNLPPIGSSLPRG
jgi:hypothetical protein